MKYCNCVCVTMYCAGSIMVFSVSHDSQIVKIQKQGVTKRCRLSWLTNSALVYDEPKGGGKGYAGSQPMSADVHIEAQINLVL